MTWAACCVRVVVVLFLAVLALAEFTKHPATPSLALPRPHDS